MFMLFLSLVGCRDYYPPDGYHDELMFWHPPQYNIKDRVCMNKGLVTYIGAALFFSYIGAKLINSYKKSNKAKRNLKNKTN